ncbi:hypothetical protein CHS0354_036110 [Potamilus streckersoni]|uniref:Uncharacterized protein n=1 Tax=Potamilus streckersoni TaxID=2493646 RepID=A0AAE0T4S0_9BIVA|nr:hypothetical protein CHS0354_036110 [Potamilus streckersoni]
MFHVYEKDPLGLEDFDITRGYHTQSSSLILISKRPTCGRRVFNVAYCESNVYHAIQRTTEGVPKAGWVIRGEDKNQNKKN